MSADSFKNDNHSSFVVKEMISEIQQQTGYLSELDGAIGDGDHGINMSKGFTRCTEQLTDDDSLSTGLETLGNILLGEIGGSMGPIYGMFFLTLYEVSENREEIDAECFKTMLEKGISEIQMVGNAKLGDKTLLDTLIPAYEAFAHAQEDGASFALSLQKMEAAAKTGHEATRNLVAKVGRASRLGERSRGKLDAGATSCYFILKSMARAMGRLLEEKMQS